MKEWNARKATIRATLAQVDTVRLVAIADLIDSVGYERKYSWLFVEFCIIIALNEEPTVNFIDPGVFDTAVEYWQEAVPGYEYSFSGIASIGNIEHLKLFEIFGDLRTRLDTIYADVRFCTDLAPYAMQKRPLGIVS